MLDDLTLSGFRTFRELRIHKLNRVNLFVGTNNAGKTSILEAAEALAGATLATLMRSPARRRERILLPREENRREPELDLSHLFFGRSLHIGARFFLSSESPTKRSVKCEVSEGESKEQIPVLSFQSHVETRSLQFTRSGGLRYDIPGRYFSTSAAEPSPPVRFLGTESLEPFSLGELWDAIVLTPEEEDVAAALRLIEPEIERIAFLGDMRGSRSIFLKLSGSEMRLPLGSVGDGLKRLLALALHLFSARGGYLLVDEIDTGLHHTAMAGMWKLVIETARRIDVQVLATTHSLDCVRALAWVQEESPELAEHVSLHRVEKGLPHTVEYSMEELAIAARNHLEVR